MLISYCFAVGLNFEETIRESSIVEGQSISRETVADRFSFCREICMVALDSHFEEEGCIGGVGEIVEIDECKIGNKIGNNAPAGTIVGNVVTNPSRFDFYLVSQSGGRGTITPSGYNVIFDSSGWGPDKIQRMTYKLTQMYFNFTGAVKVPAPCQYAHKLAALVAQAIQKPPSIQLETLLYYL